MDICQRSYIACKHDDSDIWEIQSSFDLDEKLESAGDDCEDDGSDDDMEDELAKHT